MGVTRRTLSRLRVSWLLVPVLFLLQTGCAPGDFWLTPDQQGRWYFERGDYAEAARRFRDPVWRGTAFYLTQDFVAAAQEFARVDSAQAWFAQGNALAHMERYEEAIAAYERALVLEPGHAAAQANIEYLQPFLPLEFEGGEMGTIGRDAAADEVVFDADRERLEEQGVDTTVEGEQEMLSDDQLADIWLRQVDASPAAFLERKFAYQAASDGSVGDGE